MSNKSYSLSKSTIVVSEYSDAIVDSLINSMGGDESSSAKIVAILSRVGNYPCSVTRNERLGDLLLLNILDQMSAVPAAVVFWTRCLMFMRMGRLRMLQWC
jgi:hypothetical protein